MTWAEVASDAVKIGLGALVGGSLSLIGAKLTHKHRKAEQYTTRRRDSLETVMPEFDALSLDIMAESVMVLKAFPEGTADEVAINTARYNFADRETAVRGLNRELNVVEAKVALLGFEDIAECIDDFRSKGLAIAQIDQSSSTAVLEMAGALEDLRSRIIRDFAEAYRSA